MRISFYQEKRISYWLARVASGKMIDTYYGNVSPKEIIDAAITMGLSFYKGTGKSSKALRYFFYHSLLHKRMSEDVIEDIVDIISHYSMYLHEKTRKVFLYLYQQREACTRKQLRDALEMTAHDVRNVLHTLVKKCMVFEENGLVKLILTFKNWLYGYKNAGELPKDHPHAKHQISTPAKKVKNRMRYDTRKVCVKYFGAPDSVIDSHPDEKIMVSCPFHSDTKPSMIVFPEGNWYCHSCHERGSTVVALLAVSHFPNDNLAELRAVEELSDLEEIGVLPVSKLAIEQQQQEKLRRYMVEKNAAIERYRGEYSLPEAYHPNWQFPSQYAHAQYEMIGMGFSGHVLQKHHVYAWDSNALYPIILPLVSERGEVVGEQKMSTPSSRARYSYAKKYMTTPGLEKSQHIYGLIRNDPVLLVVEGYKDMLMADQRGLHNVATTLGSDFSDAQANIIAARYKYVVCGYDNDVAGHRGSEQMREKLSLRGVFVVRLDIKAKDVHAAAKEEFRHAIVKAFKTLGMAVPLDVLNYDG